MHRRWLVYTPGDRLEVANVEDPWIFVAIPANDITGVEVVPVAGDGVTHLDPYLEFAPLAMRYQLFRAADVTFAIGCMLQHLTVPIEVTARRLNCTMSLNREEARSGTIVSNIETEGCATRDHDVVSLVIGKQTEVGLKHSMPLVDKVNQVRIAVAIEVVHIHRRL